MNFLSSCFGGSKSNLNGTNNNYVESPDFTKKPSDEDILRYENELRSEEAAQAPLVSPLLPLSCLLDEFHESPNYTAKLATLQDSYKAIRKCRRDGNCFYRAVAFELIEAFKEVPESHQLEQLKQTWDQKLASASYEKVIYEDFSESFWSHLINNNDDDHTKSTEAVWESDEYTSNMAIMFLRLLTSAHIRSHPDDYSAFIEMSPQDSGSIEKWCERCVDAVGVDADQVQLIALAKTLKICLVVVNLGSGLESDDLQINEFNFISTEKNTQIINLKIHLLYRPGHYDIIYPL